MAQRRMGQTRARRRRKKVIVRRPDPKKEVARQEKEAIARRTMRKETKVAMAEMGKLMKLGKVTEMTRDKPEYLLLPTVASLPCPHRPCLLVFVACSYSGL